MRVVVPATNLRSATESALGATGYEWEAVDVSGSSRAYFDLLSAAWAEADSVVLIEHDIVVHPGAIEELDSCPHDWCGFPHEMGEWGVQYGLGCVKFSHELIVRNPDAMTRVGVLYDDKHPKRHWCRLDAWLQGIILPNAGETKHHHPTVVKHLGSGNSHGCITN